jgi:hypothetical protein
MPAAPLSQPAFALSASPPDADMTELEELRKRLMELENKEESRGTREGREVRLEHLLLMDLVTRQEVDGRWLSKDVQVTAQKPDDFPDQDLWTTLCVMVFIEVRFAEQAEEWQLVVRKARKWFEKAEVSLSRFGPIAKAQLGL